MKNFGFEKGECKKGFIKKGSENHLAAYDFKFNDFILYSTEQPNKLYIKPIYCKKCKLEK